MFVDLTQDSSETEDLVERNSSDSETDFDSSDSEDEDVTQERLAAAQRERETREAQEEEARRLATLARMEEEAYWRRVHEGAWAIHFISLCRSLRIEYGDEAAEFLRSNGNSVFAQDATETIEQPILRTARRVGTFVAHSMWNPCRTQDEAAPENTDKEGDTETTTAQEASQGPPPAFDDTAHAETIDWDQYLSADALRASPAPPASEDNGFLSYPNVNYALVPPVDLSKEAIFKQVADGCVPVDAIFSGNPGMNYHLNNLHTEYGRNPTVLGDSCMLYTGNLSPTPISEAEPYTVETFVANVVADAAEAARSEAECGSDPDSPTDREDPPETIPEDDDSIYDDSDDEDYVDPKANTKKTRTKATASRHNCGNACPSVSRAAQGDEHDENSECEDRPKKRRRTVRTSDVLNYNKDLHPSIVETVLVPGWIQCPIPGCETEFDTARWTFDNVCEHIKYHHRQVFTPSSAEPETIRCPRYGLDCDRTFVSSCVRAGLEVDNTRIIERHLMVHHLRHRGYMCPVCEEVYLRRDVAQRHVATVCFTIPKNST